MHARIQFLTALAAVFLVSCASSPPAAERVAAGAWRFRIEGQLASVSVSDLVAVVQAMQPTKIYRVRVINRNRMEVDTASHWVTVGGWKQGRHVYRRFYDNQAPKYTIVERVRGVWQLGDRVFITH